MVKILHTADLHLDSAFAGLSSEKASNRRKHQRELLMEIVELANTENTDIVLLAGDLFDGDNAYYDTAYALCEILAKCRARVFVAPGNHDAYNTKSPYNSIKLPENVHIFTSQEIEGVEIPELNTCVYGAGFTTPECEKSLLGGFSAPQDGKIHIMVLHGEVTEGYSKYNAVKKEDIALSNLNYLALGHVHTYSGILREGKTEYAYCGCPEGRGFDEVGTKGIIIGEVGQENKLSFKAMCKYSYRVIEIEVSGEDDVKGKISDALPESDEYGLYRVVVTGECAPFDAKEIEDELKNRYYLITVTDRTTLIKSVWDGENEDNLKGVFLRRMHLKYSQTNDDAEKKLIKEAALFGVAAIENREEPR